MARAPRKPPIPRTRTTSVARTPTNPRHSYNVAAIRANGCTISTQLWGVDEVEPYRCALDWSLRYAGDEWTDACPVVIARHGGATEYTTLGAVRAYLRRLGYGEAM